MKAPPKQIGLTFLLLFAGMFLAGAASRTDAMPLSGQFSVYSYLRDDSVDHAMIVPSLTLNAYQVGHRDVSFQTTLRGFADMRNGESADEQVRVQRALLLYTPRGSKWQVRLGQQWINEGVGHGNVAGLWTKYAVSRKTDVIVYAGTKIARTFYFDEEEGDNEAEGLNAGLRAKTRFGRYTAGVSYTHVTKGGDVQFSGAGVDASGKPFNNFIARARVDMNLEQSTIETAQAVGSWTPLHYLMLTGELRSQTPRIYEDSYFVRFLEEASTNYARGSVKFTYYEDYYVKYNGYMLFTDEDNLYKVQAALGCENLEVGYTHWLSVAEGDMDGFYGTLMGDIRVNDRDYGGVFAGFDFAKGSNSDYRENTQSQSVYFGATTDVAKDLGLLLRAENIKDERHSSDWRGLFGVTWRFSTLAGRVKP